MVAVRKGMYEHGTYIKNDGRTRTQTDRADRKGVFTRHILFGVILEDESVRSCPDVFCVASRLI